MSYNTYMKKNEVNMLSGSIVKGLLSISIPIMIMNVFQNLFSVIDMTMLGNMVDDNAVGAVGASGMLITLVTSLLIGVSSGTSVVVARYIGRGDQECVRKTIGTALVLAVLGGFALMIIGFSFAETFLAWTNCSESLMGQAVLYFRLYFCGVPLLMVYNFSASILRAMGDSKRPMYFLLFGGVIKIICNFVFIKCFHTTVEGVAISTIISWLVAGVACFTMILKNDGLVKFEFKHFKFYGKHIKEIIFIGIPAGMESALYSLANVVITAAVNAVGPEATKGMSIANQFDGILYQIAIAPSLAVMSYVSQNVGVGNLKRAGQSVVKAMIITVCFGATFGGLSAIFSGQLSSLMSQNPEVIAYSKQKMVIVSSTYFICGINHILCAALRGMKNPIVPTVSTLIFMCLIRFPWVYFVYPLVNNLTFLFLIWPIGWILSIALLTFTYFITKRKIHKEKTGAC